MDDPAAVQRAQEQRVTLQDLLATVGDEPDSDVPTELRDLSATLLEEGGPSGELLASCLLRCGLELSYKGEIYAAAVALLGRKDEGRVARRVVDGTLRELKLCLRDGLARRGRTALRFLEGMAWMKVVDEMSVVSLLTDILEEGEKDEGGNARARFYTDIVVSVLPWLRAHDGVEKLAQRAIHALDAWDLGVWRHLQPIIPASASAEGLCNGRLTYLKAVLTDWLERERETSVLIDYRRLLEDDIGKIPPIALSPINMPAHAKTSRYSPPTFFLNLTQDGDIGNNENAEDEQRMSLVDLFIVQEFVLCILDNFSTSHGMAADRLLRLPLPRIVNSAVVNSVFAALTALPVPSHSSIYYGTVFVDLCKVKDSSLPIKLLAAVESLFSDAESLDAEVFDRLTSWFAYHLSNYGYKWNWSDWALYVDPALSEQFPFRALFCKDVLARCVRLSYYDRIAKAIPDDLHVFLPPKPQPKMEHFDPEMTANLMKFVTGQGRLQWTEVKEKLEELIPEESHAEVDGSQKPEADKPPGDKTSVIAGANGLVTKSPEHILDRDMEDVKGGDTNKVENENHGREPTEGVQEGPERGSGQENDAPRSRKDANVIRLSSLLRALLNAGSKILSHFDIVTERYNPLLHELCSATGERGQQLIVTECAKFWEDSHLHRLYVTDKLYSSGIIPASAIIVTLLTCDEDSEQLHKVLKSSTTWEALRLVFTRHRARVSGAAQELAAASAAASHAAEGDLDAAQQRLSSAKENFERGKEQCQELISISLAMLERSKKRAAQDKVIKWRINGMMREIARKHSDYLQSALEDLRHGKAEQISNESSSDSVELLEALGNESFSVVVS